jgi:serine/threonine-protein kinase HipA
VHQEDFCQVFNVPSTMRYTAASYRKLVRDVLKICGVYDAHEVLRRLAFMIVSGNTDLHLKNWSLWYPDGVNPRLAPAYDLISTIPFIAKRTPALKFGRRAELMALSLEHVQLVVEGLDGLQEQAVEIFRETLQKAMAAWREEFSREAAPAVVRALDDLHRCSVILREVGA